MYIYLLYTEDVPSQLKDTIAYNYLIVSTKLYFYFIKVSINLSNRIVLKISGQFGPF